MAKDNDARRMSGEFGKLVRGHRERLGIPMNRLAQEASLDQGLLSKIERGLRPPPEIVPFVERLARCFQLDTSSAEYRQLMDAAYRDRFADDPPAAKRPAYLMTLGFERRGLGGLPPEFTGPDSPAGRYFKSLGHKVGERLKHRDGSAKVRSEVAEVESPALHDVPSPQADWPGMASSLGGLQLFGATVELIKEFAKSITRLEFDGKRCTAELAIDGREFVVSILPKSKAKRRRKP